MHMASPIISHCGVSCHWRQMGWKSKCSRGFPIEVAQVVLSVLGQVPDKQNIRIGGTKHDVPEL
jgi:hypothetical protein